MSGDRISRLIRSTARKAGKQFGEAKRAYRSARIQYGLPTDDAGRAKIVCRRYAEKRTATIDDRGRPACYEGGHPDCEGCAEDVREGRIETW
ncbi:hypothetical protein G9464_03645 [Halostella sp. JP-L12]|uniref:DUF7091 family protein n=1 Tax=Halostella TaxID=1843185 RepID=UPI000EF7D5E4|nr:MULTISPECIES: hypothetical protein [Halostella]NHN46689.1 hypothetical protein [Halostella sp. JP-L12]